MNLETLRTLADHLWQSTWFAAFAALPVLALRKNRARVRHGVWLAASAKFLIPMSVLIALGGQFAKLMPVPRASPVAHPRVLVVANEVSRPFAASAAVLPIIPQPALPASNDLTDLLPTALLILWSCGFLGIACAWFVRWRRIRAAVRAGSSVELDIPIPAMSSSSLPEPGVFGIIRPTLLLPEGMEIHLSPAQFKAVIAHELCHVRHRDNLAAAFQMFVETVFWFHPLVWWIGKRMVAERERACDEEVLRLGNQPRVYAEGILNVCRLFRESPVPCISGVAGGDLKQRIRAILSGTTARDLGPIRQAGLAVLGTACLLAPFLIGVWNASLARAESQVTVHALPAPNVRFRSAEITPCPNYSGLSGIRNASDGRLVLACENVDELIRLAYVTGAITRAEQNLNLQGPSTPETPITASPALWGNLKAQRFNIEAHADTKATVESMAGPMLQSLLADRFGLKIHGETRTVPMFALTVAKGGSKLKPADEAGCGKALPRGVLQAPPPPPGKKGTNCASFVSPMGQSMTLAAEASTLAEFCRLLSGPMGGQVIDKTGISGKFDIHLMFAGNQPTGALGALYRPLPEAIQELGLSLERTTGPREFLVVDHVEKPTGN